MLRMTSRPSIVWLAIASVLLLTAAVSGAVDVPQFQDFSTPDSIQLPLFLAGQAAGQE